MSLGVVQLVTMGLPLLALPYLALQLGSDQLGRLAFAVSVAQVILILTDYGFNLSASKAVSIHRHDTARVAEIWVAVTLIRAMFAALGLAVLLLAAAVFERFQENLTLLLVAYTMVIGNILFPQWLFQGLEQLKLVSLIQVLTRCLSFVCIFLFVKGKGDLYLAVFFQSAGLLLGGLVALPSTLRVFRGVPLAWPAMSAIARQLKDGWHVFVSTALTNIYTQGNAMFLGVVAPPAVVGQYYLAERLIRATQLLYGPISNTIYPHIARLARDDKPAALAFVGNVLRYAGAAGVALGVLILFLAPLLAVPVFGPEHAEVGTLLQIFAPLPLILIVSNTLTIQTMLPFDMQNRLTRIYFSAAVLNLLIFLPMAKFAGAPGAAVANILVETLIVVLLIANLRQAGIHVTQLLFRRRPQAPGAEPVLPPSSDGTRI